jgi:hypothetical protein
MTRCREDNRRSDGRRRVDPARWQASLDEHQVRRWRSWYRWITLAVVAVATPASSPRPGLPPPPASQRTMKITIYG